MSAPHVGQVRRRMQIEADRDGDPHITDVTSEAWTGNEWVDVRELVHMTAADLRARIGALAEELEGGQAEALACVRALHLAERPGWAEAYGYRANAYASAAARLRALLADTPGGK